MNIYLARADRLHIFKVGRSVAPELRVEAISAGFPVPVVLDRVAFGRLSDERRIHLALGKFRIRGEWFASSGLQEAHKLFDEHEELLASHTHARERDAA
jgi:hypothetical protein